MKWKLVPRDNIYSLNPAKLIPYSKKINKQLINFCCSVFKSCLTLHNPMDYSMPGSCPSLSPGDAQTRVLWVANAICLNLCHPRLILSLIFPNIRSFPMSWLFASCGQSIGASVSASVNIQGWFPLRLTNFISLQSKKFSRVFSNNTVQKHQFFCTQLSL